MIENHKCPICGGNIIFRWKTIDRYFQINSFGNLKEEEHYDQYVHTGIEFFCEEDMEHDIYNGLKIKLVDVDRWVEEVEEEIYDLIY